MIFQISKRKLKRLLIIILLAICGYNLLQVSNFILIKINIKNTKSEMKEAEKRINLITEAPAGSEYINEGITYNTKQFTEENIKFILLMTSTASIKFPFTLFGEDNAVFIENECDYTNCYITYNKSSLDESSFDMVAFNSVDLQDIEVPETRLHKQKYAFFSIESPQYNPVCIDIYDDFFNWTFTYKLNSDFRLWFFDIYTINETKIGPPVDVWPNFQPIDDDLKVILDSKTKIAAWFVSNCDTKSGRELIARELDEELKERYNWSIDIYGNCGTYACPRRYAEICNRKIEENYFFYLAFENSFGEDYVTEKILLAVNNYAVPIVFGGANYSRFLPPESYLNIQELGVKEVARLMHKAFIHREFLYDYFKWTSYLSYRHVPRKSQICRICEILNDKEEMNRTRMYPEFRNWWNNDNWENECYLTHDFF